MTLKLGEIVLVLMQSHQAAGTKMRPAAVLLDTGDDDFVAAPVTSAPSRSELDVALEDWRQASTIRVHKLTVLSKPEILRTVGTLTERDRKSLGTALYHAFGRG